MENPILVLANLLRRSKSREHGSRFVEDSLERLAARILFDLSPKTLGVTTLMGSVVLLQQTAAEAVDAERGRTTANWTPTGRGGSGDQADAILRRDRIEQRVRDAIRNNDRIAWFVREAGYADLTKPKKPCKACRSPYRHDVDQLIRDGSRPREVEEWLQRAGAPVSKTVIWVHKRECLGLRFVAVQEQPTTEPHEGLSGKNTGQANEDGKPFSADSLDGEQPFGVESAL